MITAPSQVLVYVKTAAHQLSPNSKAAKALLEWASQMKIDSDTKRPVNIEAEITGDGRNNGNNLSAWNIFMEFIESYPPSKELNEPLFMRNVDIIGHSLNLSHLDINILQFVISMETDTDTETLFHLMIDKAGLSANDAISLFIGENRSAVEQALKLEGKLLTTGLIERTRLYRSQIILRVHDRLLNALSTPATDSNAICESLFGKSVGSDLKVADFSHIARECDLALGILRGALKSRAQGVNILLHGMPGSGKTALCALLAKTLSAQLRMVGVADERGDDPNSRDRLREMRLAQNLLAPRERNIILFDELEDITGSRGGSTRNTSGNTGCSKVFLNRLLEANPIPILWTTNDLDEIDPAFLRRMTMTLEVPNPPKSAQRKIWRTTTRAAGLRLSNREIQTLSGEIDAPAGLIATAAKGAKLAGGGVDELRTLLRASTRVQGIKQSEPVKSGAPPIDLFLFNADIDLAYLTEQLACRGNDPVSLCLHGMPGTGKSEYVRFLADRMRVPVIQRRASDLLGMYVGQSERNIAAAFRTAKQEGAFLIFDEADSLLRSRSGAHRGWEVSQVNEMLTWMEHHPLPFACTTNLMEALDPAAARRFTFKICFQGLSQEQQRHAFRLYFAKDAPKSLCDLQYLTPGDFAVVRKKSRFLKIKDQEQLVDMLRSEQAHRCTGPREIGFALRNDV